MAVCAGVVLRVWTAVAGHCRARPLLHAAAKDGRGFCRGKGVRVKCLFLPLQEMPGLSCIEFFAGKAVIAAAWQARGYAAEAMDVLRASAQTEVVLR